MDFLKVTASEQCFVSHMLLVSVDNMWVYDKLKFVFITKSEGIHKDFEHVLQNRHA